MGRILAIDYGAKKIGLAISDETKTIATGLNGIRYKKLTELIEELKILCQEKRVERIILGYPISMAGKITKLALEVMEFKKNLETDLGLPVELLDERLTTEIAKQIHQRVMRKPTPPKSLLDKISAIIILQDYLQRIRKNE
jgi:putative Holliday junction resolvase